MRITGLLTQYQITPKDILIKVLLGWGIGLVVISLFVFGVDDPDPQWPPNWRVRPLILTPLATAFGMLAFFLKNLVRPKGSGMNILIFLVSVLGFVFSLWIGIVLGLDGTMWD